MERAFVRHQMTDIILAVLTSACLYIPTTSEQRNKQSHIVLKLFSDLERHSCNSNQKPEPPPLFSFLNQPAISSYDFQQSMYPVLGWPPLHPKEILQSTTPCEVLTHSDKPTIKKVQGVLISSWETVLYAGKRNDMNCKYE